MMASFKTQFAAVRIVFVCVAVLTAIACDSNGDSRQLSNLVRVADAGYTSIEINGDTDTVIELNATQRLSLEAFTDDDPVGTSITTALWRSNDDNIATVSDDGTVTGGSVDGEVEITAAFGNLTTTANVRVSSAELVSIVIETENETDVDALNSCSATQFVAMGVYEAEAERRRITDKVVWSTSGTSAAFRPTGLLRVTSADQFNVIATRPASPGKAAVVEPLSVTVLDNLESISIDPDPGELAVRSPLQYRAFPTYRELGEQTVAITDNLDWSLEDVASSGAFAQIDNTLPEKGVVTASRVGDGVITARCTGTGVSQSLNINAVGSGRLIGLQIETLNTAVSFPLSLPFTGDEIQQQLIARALFADQPGGRDVTADSEWTIGTGSDPLFTIGNDDDDKGLLTINGVGTVNVTARFVDEDNNDAVLSDTVEIEAQQ